jgi:hypothetical protein
MNDTRKSAYRHLLYFAMIDIRNLCQPRGNLSSNPLTWRRQYLKGRLAGAVADWLHNLAAFSVCDFVNFKEEDFWREGEGLSKRQPAETRYREIFEEYLNGRAMVA